MKVKKTYPLTISPVELERRWIKLYCAFIHVQAAAIRGRKIAWQSEHALLRHLKHFRDTLDVFIEAMEDKN